MQSAKDYYKSDGLNQDQQRCGWGTSILALPDLGRLLQETQSSQELQGILKQRKLNALFQPIIDLNSASVFGHEGLIRGPTDSLLHSPLELFAEAELNQVGVEVEHLSRQIVLESFAQAGNARKLFLNVSPASLVQPNFDKSATLSYIEKLGLNPRNIIIELTESAPCLDFKLIYRAAEHYRNMGFKIAMDDLGEGFSSLRLWSELQPDYVKIDKHFIRGINTDQVKLEFVRSIQQIAQSSGAYVIAEGIETEAELLVIKDLKIAYGQGYLLGRPAPKMLAELPEEIKVLLNINTVRVYQAAAINAQNRSNVSKLIKYVPTVSPNATNEDVYHLFQNNSNLYSLPVVDQGRPVGLISRYSMIDGFARPYQLELHGKRLCATFMDKQPLIVDKGMKLQALSGLITDMEPHHLSNGFIITDDGKYLGMGGGHDLLREITQMQINAARYANPLTMLPGNVPISEHMDRLLEAGITFYACYCDLDSFKPFNDAYGFRRGDELIQFVGKLLGEAIASEFDFVGHVGGDDFIVLFQSDDWEKRCEKILDNLKQVMPDFYDQTDQARGGVESEDRLGNKLFYPYVSMSIGAVRVDPSSFPSHHEISTATAFAKKQAKKIAGNSLFLERRMPHPGLNKAV